MISSARTSRLVALVATTVLGLSVATAAPASAASRTIKDGRGDTWNVAAETPKKSSGHPEGDIRKLRITHTARKLVVTAHVQDLKKAGDAVGLTVSINTPSDVSYSSEAGATPSDWQGSASWYASDGTTCSPKLAMDYRGDTMRLTVPTSCLADAAWVRLRLGTFFIKGQEKAFYDDATGKKLDFEQTRQVRRG